MLWGGQGLAGQGVTPTAAKSVTLEQAVQLTLEHSPGMTQAEGAIRTTTAAQRSAYGGMLPSLSLSSGANRGSATRFNSSTNTTVSAASQSYTAGLTASMDVFAGGRHLAAVRQATADNAAADASLIQQRFAVTLVAKTAFFNVLRTGELVRVAQAQLEQAQQGLDAANQRMKVGSATQSDVLRAQLALNQAKQALAQAQTNESSAQYALGRLVGESGPVTATAPASLEPTPLAVPAEQLPALVDAQAPTVVTAQEQVKSGAAAVSVAKAQYMPTLRLSAGDNWVNQIAALSGGDKSWSLGLSLSYPIFNGFQREQNVETANVQADNARVALDDARLNARATLESNLAALRLAEQQVQLTREATSVAQEDMRVQNERYRLGAGTMLDRLTSQAALVQAQTNEVNARYDYQLARATLEALVGRSL